MIATTMRGMWALMATAFLLAGTVVQYRATILDVRAREPDVAQVFATVDGWFQEVRWWRPVLRRRHRRTLRQLLVEDQPGAEAYWRVRRLLTGWSLLVAGAGAAVIDAAISVVAALIS